MFKSFLSILYPPRCPLCDELRPNRHICENCRESLHVLEGDFTAPHLKRVWFRRARSCFTYEGKLVDAIHGFKYSRRFDLTPVFARFLADEGRRIGEYDFILPIPLHWLRLWMRGYNPSAILARSLGRQLEIAVDCHALKKRKNILPQVGLERDLRLQNVRGAFRIMPKRIPYLQGKDILLIDDVLTTGATVNECAKMLMKKAGCESVDVLTIARTI